MKSASATDRSADGKGKGAKSKILKVKTGSAASERQPKMKVSSGSATSERQQKESPDVPLAASELTVQSIQLTEAAATGSPSMTAQAAGGGEDAEGDG